MITVPKKAFEQPDDSGESVAPGMGDEVDLGGVKAKVIGEAGDNLSLDILSVNDVPVSCGEAKDDGDGEDAEDGPDLHQDAADMQSVAGQGDMQKAIMKKLAKRDRKAGY